MFNLVEFNFQQNAAKGKGSDPDPIRALYITVPNKSPKNPNYCKKFFGKERILTIHHGKQANRALEIGNKELIKV
jgi:hypothetical protein